MTTVQNLIDICRDRYLLGGTQELRNRLAAAYVAGSGTLQLAFPSTGIANGSRLSIGMNTFYVWSVDTSSNICVVSGGEAGSTDVNAAINTVVKVNPRFTDRQIFDGMNEDLLDLGSPASGLYQVKLTTLIYNPAYIGYDLPGVTSITKIIEIRYDEPDGAKRTPVIPASMYSLERNNAIGDYSSTFSLKLKSGGFPGRNVNILYRAPFGQYATTADDVLTVGLSLSMTDLPPMGAAIRLLAGREVRRNQTDSQGDTRRAEEVTAGSIAASWRGIAALRQGRIQGEVQRLNAAYPDRAW